MTLITGTNYNYEAIETVLKHIKTHPKQFDMHFFHVNDKDCGTVGCIAGWTCMLLDKNYDFSDDDIPSVYYVDTAKRILGLSHREIAIFNSWRKPYEVIRILEKAVEQKNYPVWEQQSLELIANSCGFDIDWEDF